MTEVTSDAVKTAYEIGLRGAKAIQRPDGGLTVIAPRDTNPIQIEPLEKPLARIRQAPTFHDSESFVAYVNAFKTDRTRLFGEPGALAQDNAAVVRAYFDYHKAPAEADRLAHAATFKPRYSDQWDRWVKVCERALKQAEFAEFIEECRADIVEPSAAQLLDVVRTFKAGKRVEFDSLVYQPNGSVMLAYDEKTEQKGTSGALPEKMTLGIPVYFRGTVYSVPVFVRYRLSGGAVMFQLKLDREDIIEDAAFAELTKSISEQTTIGVFMGRA